MVSHIVDCAETKEKKEEIEGFNPSFCQVVVFLRPRATKAATAMMTITTMTTAAIVRLELGAAAAAVVAVEVGAAVVGDR